MGSLKCLAIFVIFSVVWNFSALFGVVWDSLRSFGSFGMFWIIRIFWDRLGSFLSLRIVLDLLELFTIFLGSFGTILSSFGII